MKRLLTAQFYQQYFAATQKDCAEGLARLTAEQKLEMLENLMQWDVNSRTDESHDLPTQV
ncbi:glucose uptake inhibitor SgrT [uncultured Cedecea sp.]|uniref:glucose uptake inhibitor SgrT n=1 Tax=uncultured Cedecea sp. TaxID=988762 RepID=UPI002633958C|nr:glucose uptake inhibitor SgrT [uncultured Cedecea sp.]